MVKEKIDSPATGHATPSASHTASGGQNEDSLDRNVFQKTQHDDKLGMSIEDKLFLDIVDKEVYMDDANCWVAPLPFRPRLPNNRQHAANRLTSLRPMLEKKQGMKEPFSNFVQGLLDADQAEPAPALKPQQERWYLPIFGVYHCGRNCDFLCAYIIY